MKPIICIAGVLLAIFFAIVIALGMIADTMMSDYD